jgi:hypothetical protein
LELSQKAVGLALNKVKDLVYGHQPWLVFQVRLFDNKMCKPRTYVDM